jgi:aminoglycoside phosphotransferase (APT) family kinase protein
MNDGHTKVPGRLLQMESAQILHAIRREIDLFLVPEIQSIRATTAASHIDAALRHLIMRDEIMPALLDRRLKSDRAAGPPDVLDRVEHKTQDDNHRYLESIALGVELESHVKNIAAAAVAEAAPFAKVKYTQCKRLIESERTYLAAEVEWEARIDREFQEQNAERSDLTPQMVSDYLSRQLGPRGPIHATGVERVIGGFSKDIFLVRLNSQDWPEGVVIRRDNPNGAVHSNVTDEAALLISLKAAGLRVPGVLIVEPDPSVFGSPFIVMERMRGRAVSMTTGFAGTAELSAAHGLAQVLARLHTLEVSTLKLPASIAVPAAGDRDHVREYINTWEAIWLQDRHQASPIVTTAFEWLRANAPRNEDLRLVHGDAGLHNLLMDNSTVSAMLDWELAHLGDPAEDLMYCRMWTDQIMPWEDFLRIYYQHGGPRYSEQYSAYYKVFRCVRTIVTCATAQHRFWKSSHPQLIGLFAQLKYFRHFQDELAGLIADLP